jgi:hypothetical protein
MGKFLEGFFGDLVETGSVEIELAGGHKFTLGDGPGPTLGVRSDGKAAAALLLLDPELNFGELWMDGRIEVTQGTSSMCSCSTPPTCGGRTVLSGSAWWERRAPHCAGSAIRTASYARNATLRTTTISAPPSTPSSSIPGCNIPAPISNAAAKISNRRSSPKSGISRRNS